MQSCETVSVTLSSSVGVPGWCAGAQHLGLLVVASRESLGADLAARLPLCWSGRAWLWHSNEQPPPPAPDHVQQNATSVSCGGPRRAGNSPEGVSLHAMTQGCTFRSMCSSYVTEAG